MKNTTTKLTKLALSGLVIVSVCMLTMPTLGFAFARDADGSRMKAKPQAVGTTQKDRLLPPKDRIDWRSFRVTKSKRFTISIRHGKKQGPAQVKLVSSQGKNIQSAISRAGGATISTVLEPGIYYVSVSAKKPVLYNITIK